MACTIEVKILPLAVASHLYLEVFDEEGRRIAQVNGLAVDRNSGASKAVGMPGDLLHAFVGTEVVLGATARCGRSDHCHQGRVIFQGSRAEIDGILRALEKKARDINALGLPYRVLSLNSNSVFRQMVEEIGAFAAIDRDALQDMVRRYPAPGFQNDFDASVRKHAVHGGKPAGPGARRP